MYNHKVRHGEVDLVLARKIGLEAAFLYDLIWRLGDGVLIDEEGFFSMTLTDLAIFSSLSKAKISKAIDVLVKEQLIKTDTRGMPRRLHISGDVDAIHYIRISEEGEEELEEEITKRMMKISEYYQ